MFNKAENPQSTNVIKRHVFGCPRNKHKPFNLMQIFGEAGEESEWCSGRDDILFEREKNSDINKCDKVTYSYFSSVLISPTLSSPSLFFPVLLFLTWLWHKLCPTLSFPALSSSTLLSLSYSLFPIFPSLYFLTLLSLGLLSPALLSPGLLSATILCLLLYFLML